jgi:D-glycero-alpha-D-manno-heptose-7-phosphate kinase
VDGVVSARAPLRIPLGGGGTDLPFHFTRHGGFVVSAAIDRHVHVLLSTAFATRYRLKHLEWEEVDDPAEIAHPILRAAIARYWDGDPFELASLAGVPPGTGLGSSGAYTVCTLSALAAARGEAVTPAEMADRACRLEIEDLGRTVGKQDQYAATHGGVNALTFERDGSVGVRRLDLSEGTLAGLRDRFLLFYSGQQRSAARMLAAQVERSGDDALTRNLQRTEALARQVADALEAEDLPQVGGLMEEQWALKRERMPDAITARIEELHQAALSGGADGAVLAGAGGGGFLLVYTEDAEATRAAMAAAEAPELPFTVEPEGCTATITS